MLYRLTAFLYGALGISIPCEQPNVRALNLAPRSRAIIHMRWTLGVALSGSPLLLIHARNA